MALKNQKVGATRKAKAGSSSRSGKKNSKATKRGKSTQKTSALSTSREVEIYAMGWHAGYERAMRHAYITDEFMEAV